MARQVAIGEARFRVRRAALLLREFTVADVVRSTGLNPDSVRTELQRMRRDGLLTSRPHPEKPKRRGGRPHLYRLTDDPEARLALAESIEAFYPTPPPADKPTSRHYLVARRMLSRAQRVEGGERERLLADAEHELAMAEQAEGGSRIPESVGAYLEYERALLQWLRGSATLDSATFDELRDAFRGIGDELMTERVEHLRLCWLAWLRFGAAAPGSVGEIAWARCLLNTVDEEGCWPDSPLLLLLLDQLRCLAQTREEKSQATAFEMLVQTWGRETTRGLEIAATEPKERSVQAGAPRHPAGRVRPPRLDSDKPQTPSQVDRTGLGLQSGRCTH